MEKLEDKTQEKFAQKLANIILNSSQEDWDEQIWKQIEKRAWYIVTNTSYGPPSM
jgi:hypothetical protein